MKTNIQSNPLFRNHFRVGPGHRCWLGLTLGLGLAVSAQACPTITLQPTNQTVSLGATVQFRVSATTDPAYLPLTYQWQHDGTNLVGTTSGVLRITNVTELDVGDYRVIVSDAEPCSVASEIAQLTIDPTFIQANRDRLGDDGFLKTGPDNPWPMFVDYDGDGWLEVVLVRGWLDSSYRNEIYENNRDGTFTRITNGLARVAGRWAIGGGIVWADFDSDGDLDCLMAEFPPASPTLFVNQLKQGSPDFIPVKQHWPKGIYASCVDYDSDGWTDIAITHWLDHGGSTGTNCLVHNEGGQFQVITDGPFALRNVAIEWHSWVDYNDDGAIDFFGVTSPFGASAQKDILFQNQGDGTFLRVTDHVLVNDNTPNIMAGWGDYDNDDDLDVYLPYYDTRPSVLYRNTDNGEFELDPEAPGLNTSQGPLSPSWGDYENDGDLDLLVTCEKGPCRLFSNDGTGRLTEISVGTPTSQATLNTYHGSWADYNNDGFLDMLAERGAAASVLFLNNLPRAGNQNHWLKVQLKGTASNSDGLGAKVRVQTTIGGKSVRQLRVIGVLPGYATELLAHFGLGDATKVDTLRIEWPSGIVQELKDVAVDQKPCLTVVESQGALPDLKPQVTDQSRDAAGVFHATVAYPTANLRCVLEASTNLVQWTKVQVRTNAPPAAMEFTDVHATNQPARFYRVIVP